MSDESGKALELARALMARKRAGDNMPQSQYLPGVPRQVHADGGKVYPLDDRSGWYGDANYQQTGGKLEMMSPDEYLSKVRPLDIDEASRDNIDDLKRHILSGRKLDPLKIDAHGREDGRHRAHAARELGIKQVPVLTWPRIARAPGGYVPEIAFAPAARQSMVSHPSIAVTQPGPTIVDQLAQSFAPPAAQAPQQALPQASSPSAATEGHGGASTSAQAALDALQAGWGGAPINVISGYRDPAQNDAVGGAKGSQHLHGNAFDIDTTGWTPEQKIALADEARRSGFTGFGFYDNNLHFDVGPARAWGPSYHQDSIPSWAQDWTQRNVYANGGRITDSDSFKRWFSGSKVRDFSSKTSSRDTRPDEAFDPLPVYHGTRHDFDEFRPHGIGTTTFMGIPVQHERHGIFFSESPEFAEGFANPPGERKTGKVGKFHLNIKNPLVADAEGYVDPRDKEKLKAVGMDPGFVENYLGAPTGNGAMWENFDGPDGKDFVDKIKAAGFDGVNFHEEDPDTGKLHSTWVAFHPGQVKSPDTNSGDFDVNDNRFTKAEGGDVEGNVADLGAAREQKQLQQFHTGFRDDLMDRANKMAEVQRKARDAGVFDGYQAGDVLQGSIHPMKITGLFMRKWKPTRTTLAHFERMGTKPTIIEHEGEQYIPMARTQTGKEGTEGWQEGDAYLDMIRSLGYPKMGGLRSVKASGGSITDNRARFLAGNHPDVPTTLYHGTRSDFTSFWPITHLGTKNAAQERLGYDRPETWNTNRHSPATEGQRNVMPVHVAMKNPFDVNLEADWNNETDMLKQVARWMTAHHRNGNTGLPGKVPYAETADNLRRFMAENPHWEEEPDEREVAADIIRASGHDGISYINDVEDRGKRSFVALHPEQIKSAIGNRGTFDPSSPDITKAEGGEIEGSSGTPTAAEGFPVSGGVRGGAGLLQTQDEAPLHGLPQSVRIPLTGETIKAGPSPHIRAVARQYMAEAGLPYNPPTVYAKVDPSRAARIASAYDQMKDDPQHPLVKASYAQMIKETMAQYRAAKKNGFKAEFWDPATEEDPYHSSPRMAVEDVTKNNHMFVFPTNFGYGEASETGHAFSPEDVAKNPMLADSGERWNGKLVTVNDIFRAVHDYYGHAKEGVGFRHDGEENAWRAHASMFSPLARLAMTTETRGQNSWLNFGPHGAKNQTARTEDTVFAPQKVGVLPHWVHHEGAEDFTRPEDVKAMLAIRKRHSFSTGGAADDHEWSASEFTPKGFSDALRASQLAPTLTQYTPTEIMEMQRLGKFSGFKLKGANAYFGVKRGTDYGDEYGFHHPALSNNETALVGVVNNDPDARGVGKSLMHHAIKSGVTALDAFAVPSDKHPRGFLPDFYSKFGFKELGRVPFDPKYVTPEQFKAMKKSWGETGWDEKRHALPDVVIMKRSTGGAVQGVHSIGARFHNGGAHAMMKRQK